MRYRMQEEDPPVSALVPAHTHTPQVASTTTGVTKTKSRPFRKVIPKVGVTIPLGRPGVSTMVSAEDRVGQPPASSTTQSVVGTSAPSGGSNTAHTDGSAGLGVAPIQKSGT